MALMLIINHDPSDCAKYKFLVGVSGLEYYCVRSAFISRRGNKVMLPKAMFGVIGWILGHIKRVGLQIANLKDFIWTVDFSILKDFISQGNGIALSVFFYGKRAYEITRNFDLFEIVRKMNQKNYFIRLCEKLGVPVPETQTFESKNEFRMQDVKLTFPFFFKPSSSVSGINVVLVEDEEQLQSVLDGFFDNEPFQLQKPVPQPRRFLNVLYSVDDFGKIEYKSISEQVLDGFVHAGNKYPVEGIPEEKVFSYADIIAAYMISNGMIGKFAFDVVVVGDDIYFLECNPRFNGSTYPTEIAFRLEESTWRTQNLITPYKDFKDIDQLKFREIEYTPEKGYGVVLYNPGVIKIGKLGVMFIGTPEEQDYCEKEFCKIFRCS